jgi:hypothetical protein
MLFKRCTLFKIIITRSISKFLWLFWWFFSRWDCLVGMFRLVHSAWLRTIKGRYRIWRRPGRNWSVGVVLFVLHFITKTRSVMSEVFRWCCIFFLISHDKIIVLENMLETFVCRPNSKLRFIRQYTKVVKFKYIYCQKHIEAHVENTCITTPFHQERMIASMRQVRPCFFLCKCPYQARKVSSYICVLSISIFASVSTIITLYFGILFNSVVCFVSYVIICYFTKMTFVT